MHAKHIASFASLTLAVALALSGKAHAAILTGSSAAPGNTVTGYSAPGLVSFDLDLATFAPTTFHFVLEQDDLPGPLGFNAIVRNLSGTALDRFSFALDGIAFAAPGSVTPAFGTLGAVSATAHTANIGFSAPEWAEFQVGSPTLAPGQADWLLDTTGLQAGASFSITATTTAVAEVPEPSSAALTLSALCMSGLLTARRRNRR